MTAQMPDELHNEHPRVRFDRLQLYAVRTGDIHANHGWGDPYPFVTPPSRTEPVNSALWRGHVAVYCLRANGTLEVLRHKYPGDPGETDRAADVHELLVGDFWLMMKQEFTGPRTYVPFHDGVIVEERLSWIEEQRQLEMP